MQRPSESLTHDQSSAAAIRDRRPSPAGVWPRHVQMWLMAGLALVIVVIILISGHAQPPRATTSPVPSGSPTPATADRIRSYQRQLADEQARQEQLDRQQLAAESRDRASRPSGTSSTAPADPITDDQHRREYQSLFADNVSFSRRGNGSPLPAARRLSPTAAEQPIPIPEKAGSASAPPKEATPDVAAEPMRTTRETPRQEHPAPGPRVRLPEGTVIETTLMNRLDGTFAGPVLGLVTTPVYSQDRQHVLIPAGARAIGSSSPVQSWGESRLAVTFHRLVMPDGHTYSLDRFKGLTQIGATGLKDEVDRHYLQVFGASLAIGAISGLAQYNTRAGVDYTFSDAYRQAAGSSLATSSSRVLDRYLNVLPTVTIREGVRIKVYLTNDLELPAYDDANGGAQ